MTLLSIPIRLAAHSIILLCITTCEQIRFFIRKRPRNEGNFKVDNFLLRCIIAVSLISRKFHAGSSFTINILRVTWKDLMRVQRARRRLLNCQHNKSRKKDFYCIFRVQRTSRLVPPLQLIPKSSSIFAVNFFHPEKKWKFHFPKMCKNH